MTISRGAFAEEDPTIALAQGRIAALIKHHLAATGRSETAVPGLTVHSEAGPTAPASFLYEPSFALIAQGSKRVMLGEESYVYDQSHFLLTAVGLPTIVQVLGATDAQPYYSIKLDIDLELARELISEVAQHAPEMPVAASGMAIGPVTPALALTAMRLTELIESPRDVPILARSLQREILYHVLTGPVGARLGEVVQIGTRTNRVGTAIRWIRENVTEDLRIERLAEIAGMGQSTLRHHFRAITAMSPLQFQKHLRLHEARRLMLNDRLDAGSAGFRVGYESATQFNREYRRLFGAPPKRDVESILAKVPQPAGPATVAP